MATPVVVFATAIGIPVIGANAPVVLSMEYPARVGVLPLETSVLTKYKYDPSGSMASPVGLSPTVMGDQVNSVSLPVEMSREYPFN